MMTMEEFLKKYGNIEELVVDIDAVNGFLKGGNMAVPSAMRIIPRQIEILDEAQKNPKAGIMLVHDSHPENALEFKTYGRHCLEGTWEAEYISELLPFSSEALHVFKNNTSAIFAPGMPDLLKQLSFLKIVKFMGVLSDYCVPFSAIGFRCFFDQNNMDIDVAVYPDAIDTFDKPGHNADEVNANAIKIMQNSGIQVLARKRK